MLCNVTINLLYVYYLSKGIIESQLLQSAAQIVKILSIWEVELFLPDKNTIGKVDSRMVYFCRNMPITRSTCIRTLDSHRADSTYLYSTQLPFTLVNGDNLTSAQ